MPTLLSRLRHRAFIAQSGCCIYCDRHMWEKNPEAFARTYRLSVRQAQAFQCTAEHLQAKQDGGKDSDRNIVAACRYCNQHRHLRKQPPDPLAHRERVQKLLNNGKWFLPNMGGIKHLPGHG